MPTLHRLKLTRGVTPYRTTWSSPVAPLKETTGTREDRLSRSFLNPDSNVSGISINGINVSKTGPLIHKHQLTHYRAYQCRAPHHIFKYTLTFLHKLGYPTRTWCYYFVLLFPLTSHSPPYNVHLRRSYLSHTSPTATRWNHNLSSVIAAVTASKPNNMQAYRGLALSLRCFLAIETRRLIKQSYLITRETRARWKTAVGATVMGCGGWGGGWKGNKNSGHRLHLLHTVRLTGRAVQLPRWLQRRELPMASCTLRAV